MSIFSKIMDATKSARALFPFRKTKYWDGEAVFEDFVVRDKDVAEFTKSHMRFIDRLDFRKVTEAVLYSFSVMANKDEKDYVNVKYDWNSD